MDIKEIILSSFQYIPSKTSSRFIYGGSCSLAIWGIDLGREVHDLDIAFPDLSVKERMALDLSDFPDIRIHKLANVPIETEWKEVEYEGHKLLVFTLDTFMAVKKYDLAFLNRPGLTMTDRRIHHKEKVIRDLAWLKEHYGLE